MQTSGWLQLALFVVALAVITKPMGLYLMQVLDANGKTWLDPVLSPLERLTYRLMGVKPDQEHDWKQYTLAMLLFSLVELPVHLRHSAPAAFAAAQSAGPRRAESRISPSTPPSASPPTPTGRATSAKPPCRISRRWSRWPFTTSFPRPPASPSRRRWCAASRGIRPKRSATSGWTWCATTYYLLLPICRGVRRLARVARHDPKLQALHQSQAHGTFHHSGSKIDDKGQPVTTNVAVMVQAPKLDEKGQPVMANGVAVMVDVPQARRERPAGHDQHAGHGRSKSGRTNHRARPDGLAGRHQNARHQRRRLRQRQRRASVREPHAALQLPPDALHLRHRQRADLLPGPHGEEPEARLVGVGGHDGAVSRRRVACAGGPKPRAIRFISNSASPWPTATWKARKSASASSTPPCSPRSRPTPRAARSIRCTIRSPRWAVSCRCSTCSSAKSSSAAWARDFTACSSSSCWRSSSPA